MNYLGNHFLASSRIVVLTVWLCLNALGNAGLHELISCGHDQKSETIAHHETDSAHWAGLETEASTDTSCSVCTVSKQTAIQPDQILHNILVVSGDSVLDHHCQFVLHPRRGIDQPRAPPVS